MSGSEVMLIKLFIVGAFLSVFIGGVFGFSRGRYERFQNTVMFALVGILMYVVAVIVIGVAYEGVQFLFTK